MKKLSLCLSICICSSVFADQVLAQYTVTSVTANEQVSAIQYGINQYNPTSITIIYSGPMSYLANDIHSAIVNQHSIPITMDQTTAYWSTFGATTPQSSSQVVVNLIGKESSSNQNNQDQAEDKGNFFEYSNSTKNSFFFDQ